MNNIFKLLVICLLASTLYACNDDKNTEESAPYFEVGTKELTQNFVAESDFRYVTVKTNREFTATSSQSWCTTSIIDDKIDNLKVIVAANEELGERTAEIVIVSPGFDNITIAVTQRSLPYIMVKESDILVEDGNLEFTLEVSANIPYSFDLPEWVQQKSSDPADDNKTWTFAAKAYVPGERSGNIVIKSADATVDKRVSIPVVQKSGIYKVASWLFDDPQDLIKAAIGKNLQIVGNTDYNPNFVFLPVDGPADNNKAVRVPLNCYFLADLALDPKPGESYISEYTLFFEFKIPKAGQFYTFFQTNLSNTDDGEIFVRSTNPQTIGVGATGYAGKVEIDTWYRLYLSFKPGDVKFFMDGVQFHSSTTSDARFRIDLKGLILCGGPWTKKDDNEFDVAEISIWNGALNAEQVAQLEGTN